MPKDSVDAFRSAFKPGIKLNDKYMLKSFAGKGGMGEVWKAWDGLSKRNVALKFIQVDKKRIVAEVRRMQATFKATNELNHQNVCPNYSLENDKKYGLYWVMRWISGSSLNETVAYNKDRLVKKGRAPRISRRDILEILRGVAAALDYSHSRHVVHRDVKPSNVFLEFKKGEVEGDYTFDVYLIDFGLAADIDKRIKYETSGTLPYMPPEQWKGQRQNEKTDQYSLAVVAYELFAGFLPFRAATIEGLKNAVLYDRPPSKGLPDELYRAIAKGLAKNKDDRYGSCSELVREIERAAQSLGEDDGERLKPPPKRIPTVDDKREEDSSDSRDYADELKPKTFAERIADYGANLKEKVTGDFAKLFAAGVSVAAILLASGALIKLLWSFFTGKQ